MPSSAVASKGQLSNVAEVSQMLNPVLLWSMHNTGTNLRAT